MALENSSITYQHRLDSVSSDYGSFVDYSKKYGSKCAGLLTLPTSWCPPFIGLPTLLQKNGRQATIYRYGSIDEEVGMWMEAPKDIKFD